MCVIVGLKSRAVPSATEYWPVSKSGRMPEGGGRGRGQASIATELGQKSLFWLLTRK